MLYFVAIVEHSYNCVVLLYKTIFSLLAHNSNLTNRLYGSIKYHNVNLSQDNITILATVICPKAGLLALSGVMTINALSNSEHARFFIIRANGEYIEYTLLPYAAYFSSGTVACIIPCNKGETIYLKAQCSNCSKTTHPDPSNNQCRWAVF